VSLFSVSNMTLRRSRIHQQIFWMILLVCIFFILAKVLVNCWLQFYYQSRITTLGPATWSHLVSQHDHSSWS